MKKMKKNSKSVNFVLILMSFREIFLNLILIKKKKKMPFSKMIIPKLNSRNSKFYSNPKKPEESSLQFETNHFPLQFLHHLFYQLQQRILIFLSNNQNNHSKRT